MKEEKKESPIGVLWGWGKPYHGKFIGSVILLHLTDVGREVAEKIFERHCFFTEQLIAAGVDPRTAEADACRIEHIISDESFDRLKEAAVQEQE